MPSRRFAGFDNLIAKWEPVLRRAFMDAVYKLRNSAQVDKIVELLQQNDIEGAVRAVGLNPYAFRALDNSTRTAFESGADTTLAVFPELVDPEGFRFAVQFNMANPHAAAWLAERSSTRIVQILDDQRVMIRNFLRAGMEDGRNPRSVALDLVGRISEGRREGGVLGLTDSQGQWVVNYMRALASDNPAAALDYKLRDRRFDSAVRTAVEDNVPLTGEQIDTMARTYTNRALRLRAEGIARTETIAALHEAQQQAIDQTVESGAIDAEQVAFVWRTARDARVRDSHQAMEGQRRALGEMFVTGAGNQLEYPGDPSGPPEEVINCRCWREPDVDFLAGIK
jgi:hypothetical protein